MLALAALSKFYMYDRLAVAPLNTQATSIAATAPGDDAQYLDVAAGLKIVNGPLKSTQVVTGDVKASKAASKELGRNVAVWDTYSCTATPDFDCSSGETPMSGGAARVAFDTHTGETVAWSGTKSETDGVTTQPAQFEGLYFKFPFDTQKKDYTFWNGTVHKALPVNFLGESKIKGLKVYKFEQKVAPIKVGTIDVPGSLVGSSDATVTADNIYSNTRFFSVEPVTGAIVVAGESPDNYLEVNGERKVTTTKATLSITDAVATKTVNDYKPKAMMLTAIKTWIPVGGTIIGLILLAFGAMARRGDTAAGVRKADKSELVGSR